MSLLPNKASLFLMKRIALGRRMPRAVRVMRFITIAGIAISVAALVVASSVGRGFEKEYLRSLLDFNAHLIVSRQDSVPLFDSSMPDIAQALAGEAMAVTPFMYREALAVAKGSVKGVVVKGVDARTVRDVNRMEFFTKEDDLARALDTYEGLPSVILGKVLFDRLNSPEKIRLMVPAEKGERFVELHVAGTFESGIFDYDSQFLFMDIKDVRKIYNAKAGEVNGFEARLNDAFLANETADRLRENLGVSFDVTTWSDLNGELIAAVKLERTVSAFIMGLLVVVAMMNLIAVMLIGLVYRLPDFSIIRAVGFPDASAAEVFTSQGLLTGASGTFFGIIIGIICSSLIATYRLIPLDPEIYLINSLPVDISPLICGIVAVFSLSCTYLASRIAARSLSKVPISEGLSRAR